MKETTMLLKLFNDHFDGDPWIDITLAGTLKTIDAAMAARQYDSLNSIWQIVLHIVSWRETILLRLNGHEIPSPENNYIETITDNSQEAWQALVNRLTDSQQAILGLLSKDVKQLYEKPAHSSYSRYELLEGILQHDAYHLGQIVIIKKLINDTGN